MVVGDNRIDSELCGISNLPGAGNAVINGHYQLYSPVAEQLYGVFVHSVALKLSVRYIKLGIASPRTQVIVKQGGSCYAVAVIISENRNPLAVFNSLLNPLRRLFYIGKLARVAQLELRRNKLFKLGRVGITAFSGYHRHKRVYITFFRQFLCKRSVRRTHQPFFKRHNSSLLSDIF